VRLRQRGHINSDYRDNIDKTIKERNKTSKDSRINEQTKENLRENPKENNNKDNDYTQ
jgi:hypothetical protein